MCHCDRGRSAIVAIPGTIGVGAGRFHRPGVRRRLLLRRARRRPRAVVGVGGVGGGRVCRTRRAKFLPRRTAPRGASAGPPSSPSPRRRSSRRRRRRRRIRSPTIVVHDHHLLLLLLRHSQAATSPAPPADAAPRRARRVHRRVRPQIHPSPALVHGRQHVHARRQRHPDDPRPRGHPHRLQQPRCGDVPDEHRAVVDGRRRSIARRSKTASRRRKSSRRVNFARVACPRRRGRGRSCPSPRTRAASRGSAAWL